ncbi:hypothetical protein BDZ91DRAFT_759451 [Kalaharituber pfeilii]|nr:hypothetical protein BDZ91DRAFT_759451 [Kalaharituber pfeilii]
MTPMQYLFPICTVTLAVVRGLGYWAKAAALPGASSETVEASKMEEIGKRALPFIRILAVGWVIRKLVKKKAAITSEIGLEVFKLKQRGEARSEKKEWEAKTIVAEWEERRKEWEWEEGKATAEREERRVVREWEERKANAKREERMAKREERKEITEWEERKAKREERASCSCGMSAAAAGELGGSSGGRRGSRRVQKT